MRGGVNSLRDLFLCVDEVHLDDISDLLSAAQRTEICIASLPGFHPAKQVRAQQKADRIVSSAAYLLQQRSFSSISVQDIAQLSQCAVTAIYARFDDKEALLPAIHLIILEHNRNIERHNYDLNKYSLGQFDKFCYDFVISTSKFFAKNRFFFEAVLRGGNEYNFHQASEYIIEQRNFYNPLVHTLLECDAGKTLAPLEFGIRILNAIYRDGIISGSHSGLTEPSALATLFSMIIRQGLLR